jgi:hypothetical protein
MIMVFVYADAARVIVARELSGCRFISNGLVMLMANGDQGVIARLLGVA